jgi:hypothetical protein
MAARALVLHEIRARTSFHNAMLNARRIAEMGRSA